MDISIIVLQGDSGRTLAFGPWHSSDSVAPGESGTTVISGHRDTHSAFLQQLKPGAELQLQTLQGEWRYRVLETRVIDSRKGGVSVPNDQHGLLFLLPVRSARTGWSDALSGLGGARLNAIINQPGKTT